MKKLLLISLWLLLGFSLISCGFGFQTQNELSVSGQGMTVEKSAIAGTLVGKVTVSSNMECESTLTDSSDQFMIEADGSLKLKNDSPQMGVYDLPVHIKCIDTSSTFKMVKVTVTDILMVAIPWITHIGNPTSGSFNATGDEYCNDIVSDSAGYTYCAGYADGSFAELTGGGADALIIKFDPKGAVVWARQLGASSGAALGYTTGADEICNSIDLDSDGNIYCGGWTAGSINEPLGGTYDAFVLKIDNDGNFQWVRQMGVTTMTALGGNANGSENCYGISVNKLTNEIYCAGDTTGSFMEGVGGAADSIVFKLASDSNVIWARHIGTTFVTAWGGSAGARDGARDIKVDSSGNIYIVGNTQCGFAEGNGGGSRYDGFVLKLDSLGAYIWVKQIGGPTATTLGGSASGHDTFISIDVDTAGNSYVAGYTESSLGDSLSGTVDMLAVKIDSTGSLDWLKQFGSTEATALSKDASGADRIYGVSVDSDGNAYFAGESDGAVGEANGGSSDGVIMKVSSLGNIEWIKQLGSLTGSAFGGNTSGADVCSSMTIAPNGSLYCAGYTASDIGEANSGGDDIMVIKTDLNGDFI